MYGSCEKFAQMSETTTSAENAAPSPIAAAEAAGEADTSGARYCKATVTDWCAAPAVQLGAGARCTNSRSTGRDCPGAKRSPPAPAASVPDSQLGSPPASFTVTLKTVRKPRGSLFRAATEARLPARVPSTRSGNRGSFPTNSRACPPQSSSPQAKEAPPEPMKRTTNSAPPGPRSTGPFRNVNGSPYWLPWTRFQAPGASPPAPSAPAAAPVPRTQNSRVPVHCARYLPASTASTRPTAQP